MDENKKHFLKAMENHQKVLFIYEENDLISHYDLVPLNVNMDYFEANLDGNLTKFYLNSVIAIANNDQS